MSARDDIQAQGTVVEVLAREAYRVELANGHCCVGRAEKENGKTYMPGDKILIAFHPYDLARGRIIPGA